MLMKNPIKQSLIDSAMVRAQNALAECGEGCSGAGCNRKGHAGYYRLSAAIDKAERFPETIQNQVDAIEDELKG
jgi:hypothetical protein